MKDKQREEILIVSQVGEEFQDVEKRYKSLRKIMKNLKNFRSKYKKSKCRGLIKKYRQQNTMVYDGEGVLTS